MLKSVSILCRSSFTKHFREKKSCFVEYIRQVIHKMPSSILRIFGLCFKLSWFKFDCCIGGILFLLAYPCFHISLKQMDRLARPLLHAHCVHLLRNAQSSLTIALCFAPVCCCNYFGAPPFFCSLRTAVKFVQMCYPTSAKSPLHPHLLPHAPPRVSPALRTTLCLSKFLFSVCLCILQCVCSLCDICTQLCPGRVCVQYVCARVANLPEKFKSSQVVQIN